MLHPTYQHLQDPIRLGPLSVLQWAGVSVCGLAAYALASWLPLPGTWSLSVAITLCGLPGVAIWVGQQSELNLWWTARMAWQWRRGHKQLGSDAFRVHGYVLAEPERSTASLVGPEVTLVDWWDEIDTGCSSRSDPPTPYVT